MIQLKPWQVAVGVIENYVLEKLPVAGDVYAALKDTPEHLKAGLTVWLQRKKNDAAIAGDLDLMDRYGAFLSGLHGEALQQAGTGGASSGRHSGQPEQLKIKSVIVRAPEIQEGETTRLTVSVQSVIGGDVNIELQSGGNAIGPVRYTKDNTRRNRQPRLRSVLSQRRQLLAARPRQGCSQRRLGEGLCGRRRQVEVRRALCWHDRARRPPGQQASLAEVETGNRRGQRCRHGHRSLRGFETQYNVQKSFQRSKGQVDDKGNLAANWSYVHRISEAGAVYEFIITAPLNDAIKEGAVNGAFACESKSAHNDTAERLPQAERQQARTTVNGLPNMSLNQGSKNIAVVLMAHSYKDAPGRVTAKRVK